VTCGPEAAYYAIGALNYNYDLLVEVKVLAKRGAGSVKSLQITEYQRCNTDC